MAGRSGTKEALFEQLARVGRALSSPKRLELLDILAQGERTVESLATVTGLRLSTTSAHLQELLHSGVLSRRKEGTRMYYRVAGADVTRLLVGLGQVASAHVADVDRAAREHLGEGVEEVGREELLRRLQHGDVLVLDVRPALEYASMHIAGASSVPLEELSERLAELPPERDVVAYCRGAYCVLAHDAVRLLHARGRSARRLEGGLLEWWLAGLPVAPG
jgi:rhodanese-related sulfurtransferase/predicted transcriptional regulator